MPCLFWEADVPRRPFPLIGGGGAAIKGSLVYQSLGGQLFKNSFWIDKLGPEREAHNGSTPKWSEGGDCGGLREGVASTNLDDPPGGSSKIVCSLRERVSSFTIVLRNSFCALFGQLMTS